MHYYHGPMIKAIHAKNGVHLYSRPIELCRWKKAIHVDAIIWQRHYLIECPHSLCLYFTFGTWSITPKIFLLQCGHKSTIDDIPSWLIIGQLWGPVGNFHFYCWNEICFCFVVCLFRGEFVFGYFGGSFCFRRVTLLVGVGAVTLLSLAAIW